MITPTYGMHTDMRTCSLFYHDISMEPLLSHPTRLIFFGICMSSCFLSMNICFRFTTIDFHLWALISFSPSQIFIYEHLFQIHHHRSDIYGHFRFTIIDFHLWALISFHHHRFSSMGISVISPPWIFILGLLRFSPPQIFIYGHFRFTIIDFHL